MDKLIGLVRDLLTTDVEGTSAARYLAPCVHACSSLRKSSPCAEVSTST